MVRLTSDRVEKLDRMTWDGTIPTARKIAEWSRNGAGNLRFGWLPGINAPSEARVFVEPDFPESASWQRAPVGTVIIRRDETEDSPLYLELPPKPADDMVAAANLLKESA